MTGRAIEVVRLERTVLQAELDYRRRRRWEIFTWANTILIGVVGAVIIFQPQTAPLTTAQQIVASVAVAVTSLYSAMWWERQRRIGVGLHERLNEVDHELGINVPANGSSILDPVGGLFMMLILGIAGVAAIWLSAT
jgi:hypothetical protein